MEPSAVAKLAGLHQHIEITRARLLTLPEHSAESAHLNAELASLIQEEEYAAMGRKRVELKGKMRRLRPLESDDDNVDERSLPRFMSCMSLSRLRREREFCQQFEDSPNDLVQFFVESDATDPQVWNVTLPGPAGTPFAGGVFNLDVRIPHDYPHRPPMVAFTTPIFHVNVARGGRIVRPDKLQTEKSDRNQLRRSPHSLRLELCRLWFFVRVLERHEAGLVEMIARCSGRVDQLRVYISTIGGGNIAIDAKSSDSIGAIKVKIQDEQGFPPWAVWLTFAGERLQDSQPLSGYDIPDGATLHMHNNIDHCLDWSPSYNIAQIGLWVHAMLTEPYSETIQAGGRRRNLLWGAGSDDPKDLTRRNLQWELFNANRALYESYVRDWTAKHADGRDCRHSRLGELYLHA